MNTEDLERLLHAGRIPEQAFPLHARNLKARLLAERRAAASSRTGAILTFITHMTKTKKFAAAGVTVAAFAFVLFGAAQFGKPTPYAQAQELVKAAQKQSVTMTDAERAELEASMNMTVDAALAEAEAAPDLGTWIAEDVMQQAVRFVTYTNTDGQKVIVGIDQEGALRFRSTYDPGTLPTADIDDDELPPDAPNRN